MARTIYDARFVLLVKTPEAWRMKQREAIAEAEQYGVKAAETVVDAPMYARIDHNRWLFDCSCGSGVAVNPDWGVARCLGLGCGRTYTNIVIPADRKAIEETLVARADIQTRNWDPLKGETVDMLVAENAAHADEVAP